MKLILIVSVLLVAAVSARDVESHFLRTNSYKHTEERAYPLHRPGHDRTPDAPSCTDSPQCSTSPRDTRMESLMERKIAHHQQCKAAGECPINRPRMAAAACVNGKAGQYDCNKVDLQAFVPVAELGSTLEVSDIWGWTDPLTDDEIAIIGMEDGTAFVQMTDAVNPIVLGFLPQTGLNNRIWSDMKVYANHVFIVRESLRHGMQVMDLTKLRQYYGQVSPFGVRQLTHDALYDEVTNTHNIVINEETGFAYLVGTSTCSGGLHVVDIKEPLNPTYAGCFANDGYTHDAQCIVYTNGPDSEHEGREICFAYNEDTLTIVDVTNKRNMRMLSRVGYVNAFYTHQGWVTDDLKYVMLNDELDEADSGIPFTRTLLWDVQDLDDPKYLGAHFANVESIDHNLYIRGPLAYLTNYCSGLRILDTTKMVNGEAPELAFFDAADYCDTAIFSGTWSNYPYFESRNIAVSNIELGLFILRPQYDQLGA